MGSSFSSSLAMILFMTRCSLRGVPAIHVSSVSSKAAAPLHNVARRGLVGSAMRLGPSRVTDEQLEEISKYDNHLAKQMKLARDAGLSVTWRELGDLPPVMPHPRWKDPSAAVGAGTPEQKTEALAKPDGTEKSPTLLSKVRSKLFGTGS